MGVYGWTVEIWSPQRQAGIEEYKFIDWYREHPLEDDLKLLKWSDEVLDGKGYVDWYPFEHPQLGPVELGGWDQHLCLPQSAAAIPGKGNCALPRLASVECVDHAAAGAVRSRASSRWVTARIACGWSFTTPAGCRPT